MSEKDDTIEAEEETMCVIQDVYLNENHEGTESLWLTHSEDLDLLITGTCVPFCQGLYLWLLITERNRNSLIYLTPCHFERHLRRNPVEITSF